MKFVVMFFYFRREREGSKLEYYYNEFVKREWYKDKNLYDNRGRRIHYDKNGNGVYHGGILLYLTFDFCRAYHPSIDWYYLSYRETKNWPFKVPYY